MKRPAITSLIVALLCAAAVGQVPDKVPAYTFVRIPLADNEDATVDAINPPTNEVDELMTPDGLAVIGRPGKYRVRIVSIVDGKFDRSKRKTFFFTIVPDGPSPGPGPDPDVPPPDPEPGPGPSPAPRPDSAIAGAAYDAALLVKRPSESIVLSKVFAMIATNLAEQGAGIRTHYETPQQAVDDLVSKLKASGAYGAPWKTWAATMAPTFRANARTFPSVQLTYEEMALGLRRAGGEQ